jgi:hypothetical protein
MLNCGAGTVADGAAASVIEARFTDVSGANPAIETGSSAVSTAASREEASAGCAATDTGSVADNAGAFTVGTATTGADATTVWSAGVLAADMVSVEATVIGAVSLVESTVEASDSPDAAGGRVASDGVLTVDTVTIGAGASGAG